MYTAFEARTVEPEEIFESGEQQVAVVVNRRLRPKGSSAEIVVSAVHEGSSDPGAE